jgi:AcrR family transcriptional regulator
VTASGQVDAQVDAQADSQVDAPADDRSAVARRPPLNRDRVLAAAVTLADESGIESVTMRRLGGRLGVEAMSLYNHVANKDALMDGMVERLAIEVLEAAGTVDPPTSPTDWKRAMRDTILAARAVMLRHPWGPGVIESRTHMIPAVVTYFDMLMGIMRVGGLSWDLVHHAMHALGSRALGFSQELFVPADGDEDPTPAERDRMKSVYPNIGGMLDAVMHDPSEESLGWCDDQTEFTFGLDLLLDGLAGHREPSSGTD